MSLIITTVNELRKKLHIYLQQVGLITLRNDIESAKVFGVDAIFIEAFKILESYYKPGEFTKDDGEWLK